jgi:choline dehydrogenase
VQTREDAAEMVRGVSCLYNSSLFWNRENFDTVNLISFQNATLKLGFPLVDDANSPHAPCDGIATMDMTVDEHGERLATSRAFLPVEVAHARKSNLTICPNMVVTHIEFSGNKQSKQAERVHFQSKYGRDSGRNFSARIKREAILCSGAFGSPQVLMLR